MKESGLPKDWKERTHFDHILGVFGVPQKVAQEVLKTEIPDGDKTTTVEKYAVRWLVKMLCVCKPVGGCLADFVNAVFAVMGKPTPENTPEVEKEVNDVLNQFYDMMKRRTYGNRLWLPHFHFHDAETDDVLSNALFKFLWCENKPGETI